MDRQPERGLDRCPPGVGAVTGQPHDNLGTVPKGAAPSGTVPKFGTRDFLLELRSEEIPARMQAGARAELERLFRRELDAAGVVPDALTVWSTPRRLALIARGVPAATAAVREEVKGPRTSAPAQALDGFLRKTGLTVDQLVERDGVWFAGIDKPGRAMADVLAVAIPAIITGFSWPKSMRWGDASRTSESLRWVRPLSGIVALLDGDVVDCAVDGITAGRVTRGHRVHSSGDVVIADAASYLSALREAFVITDQDERAAIIRDGAARAVAEAGLALVADDGLVVENAGLTEWPVPLLGRFDAAFLDVPGEVIQLTARVNQKYFVCHDSAGKLANAFICTANIVPADGGAGVVDGNRKVLAARLADARFFWEQDQKKTLAQHAERLASITFHEKLGTVADKVERVAKLARWLCEEGIVAGDPALAEQAARLCKADLVTEMVGEFPELQGIMGGYYARAEGLDPQIADAIRDHYKPVGRGDDVPTAPVTVAVSLADKLDTIFAFFAADEKLTGSKDPYALRRAALGVLSYLRTLGLRLPLTKAARSHLLCKHGFHHDDRSGYGFGRLSTGSFVEFVALSSGRGFGAGLDNPTVISHYADEIVVVILDFFADRLKVQQREADVRHDLIDAVFALGNEDDLVRLLARVHALQAFMDTADGTNLHAAYKRAANLLKNTAPDQGGGARAARDGGGGDGDDAAKPHHHPADGPPPRAGEVLPSPRAGDALLPVEAALLAALDAAEPAAAAAVANERFTDAMAALASLRAPIDAFFEGVMVNDPDPDTRGFRLNLLARFTAAVHNVADFSRIEG